MVAALHLGLYSERRKGGMGMRRSMLTGPVSHFLAATGKGGWELLAASTLLPAPHTPPDVDADAAAVDC